MQNDKLDDSEDQSVIASSQCKGIITLDDVKFVSNIHSQLLHLYTKSEWLSCSVKNIECDFVTSLVEKFKLFRLLLEKYNNCLNYTTDVELLGSFHVLIHVAQHFGSVDQLSK